MLHVSCCTFVLLLISPKVNVITPKVNIKYCREFGRNLEFLKFPVGGSRSQGFHKYQTLESRKTCQPQPLFRGTSIYGRFKKGLPKQESRFESKSLQGFSWGANQSPGLSPSHFWVPLGGQSRVQVSVHVPGG